MKTEDIYVQLVEENNAEFAKLGKTVAFLFNQLETNTKLTDEQKNKIREECNLLNDMRTKLYSIKAGGVKSAIENGNPDKVAEHIAAIKESNGGVYAYTYGQYPETQVNYNEYGEVAKKHEALLGEISEFISFKDFDSYVPPTLEDTRKEVSKKVLEIVESNPEVKAILDKTQKDGKNPVLNASVKIENMNEWKETFTDFSYVPITFEDQFRTSDVIPSNVLYRKIDELMEQRNASQEKDNEPKVKEENLELIYQDARKKNLLQKAFDKVKSFLTRNTQDKGTNENLR